MTTDTKTIAELEEELQDEIVSRSGKFPFTRRELTEAFALVQSKVHWKGPIDAEFHTGAMQTMSEREVESVRQAIVFFTGSVPEIKHLGNFRFRVRADGYWGALGA